MNKRQKIKSMKLQIALPVALLITATIAVISFIGYRASSKALENAFVQELNTVNREITDRLDSFYDQQEDFARLLAGDATLQYAIATGDLSIASQYLKRFFDELDLFENVFLSTPEFDTEILADGTGGTAVGVHWAGGGFDDNIKQTLNGNLWLSAPYRSPVTNRPVVLVTAPMYSGEEIIAIVGLPFDLGKFTTNLIGDTMIGETGFPTITTLEGLVFAHPDEEYILEMDVAGYDWGVEMIQAHNGDHIYFEFEDVDKVLAVSRNEKYGFIVSSSIEMQEIRAVGLDVATTLVIVGLVGLVLTVGIVLLLLFRKLKPIARTVEMADRISLGDFDVEKLELTTHDEMAVLANSFNQMLESLKYKAGIMETIASGDLTTEIQKTSEVDGLGQSLLKMNDSLNGLLSQVDTAVDQVYSGSDQVAQSSQILSQGATEQASSLEEITSSLTEINHQSKNNVENAEGGNQQMKDLVEAMVKINSSSDETKKIVKVIDDIAFQINLLALNANVEAARAGKYGKGFAVVADEVRNLAFRSAEAVKETTEMMDESVRSIEAGNVLAASAAEKLEEMAKSSQEQAMGIEQINSGLEQIDQVTQANTASAEESASAAEELASQALQLKDLISRFKLAGNGSDSNGSKGYVDNLHQKKQEQDYRSVAKSAGDSHLVIKLDDDDFGKF